MCKGFFKKIMYCLVTIAAVSIITCKISAPVSAISDEELTKKALLNALKTCGSTTYLKASINQNYFLKLDNLFTSAGKADGKIRVPTLVGNTIKDGDLSCQQVFAGYHKSGQDIKGLTEYPGKEITKDNLTSIGYRISGTADASSITQQCIQITYDYEYKKLFGGTEWRPGETKKYCFWVVDGLINITPSGDHNVTTSDRSWYESNGDVQLTSRYDNGYWLMLYIINGNGTDKNKEIVSISAGEGDKDWASFKAAFDNAAASINSTNGYQNAKVVFSQGTDTPPEDSIATNNKLQFSGTSSKLALLRFFAGDTASWDSIKFTEAEKTDLLRKYVKSQIDNGKVKQGECDTLEAMKSKQGDKEMYVYQPNTSKDKYCLLEGADKVTQKFNAPRAGNDILYPESFLTIVTSLMPKAIADKNQEIRHPAPDPDDASGEDDDGVCWEATAPLGWVICPVLSIVGDATKGMYSYLETHFLTIDSSYMESGDKHGTWKAWDNFRNIANICFAIVLIVIILSQITGFGVSNYGIKKMLPALIMVAILSNLSFFLCQIAVDLSNIAGYNVNRLLVDIAPTPGDEFGDGSLGMIVANTLRVLGVGTAAGALGVFAVIKWRTWIWPLLLIILSAVIGVFFFFLLLGARQAGIIVLVALAPVAIVCYALPNTKSVFSRWWKMFVALLLVYPICGALMGGGQFASRLMLANAHEESGFIFVLVAMLLQSVTFFFVPSIVKSSFAAMGNLGMKLSNFGRGLSRGATGAIRRSEGYKDRVQRGRGIDQANSARRAMSRQAWRDKHGLSVRGRASAWAGREGPQGWIGNAAKRSRENSQARWINAIAAQQATERRAQMTAAGGLTGAERRQNEELRKFHADTYNGDRAFKSDLDAQEAEYERALDAVDNDPTNEAEIARLRALQDVIGSTSDGQDRIQRVLNRRLYKEQTAALAARRTPVLSAGLQAAKETLVADHGGFKSGNRGLAATLKDMDAKGTVFQNGTFTQTGTDQSGNAIYGNSYYGAQAAKGSAYEMANANDDTLKNLKYSISTMTDKELWDTYRNASEAITNDTIAIKQGNEDVLNDIRQAAWSQIQTNNATSGAYYDDQGRRFEHKVGSFYEYEDSNNVKHTYKLDSNGDFKEMGGAGEVVDSSKMMSAGDRFTSQYGDSYRELHAGDTYKINHQYTHAEMPTGWHQRKDGNWYNGNTRLTPDEVARAEEIRRYNNQVDIHNS